jgi:hypothetical protein
MKDWVTFGAVKEAVSLEGYCAITGCLDCADIEVSWRAAVPFIGESAMISYLFSPTESCRDGAESVPVQDLGGTSTRRPMISEVVTGRGSSNGRKTRCMPCRIEPASIEFPTDP